MRADVERAMQLLREHGPGHLERALELLQNTVFSFSMTVCGHREDAEDTAQEVLLKAIPYLERFEDGRALTAWLYTVARNRCWMSRRRSKFAPAQQLSLEDLMPDAGELDRLSALAAGESPERAAMTAEDVDRLKRAILALPPQYRLVLVLRDVEELSTEQIAGILGIKEANVRVRLHRARLFVRQEFARTAATNTATSARVQQPTLQRAARSPRCRQIFANLSNYLDGILDDSLCAELQRHMTGCKPCEAFLANLQSTVQRLHELPAEALDPQRAADDRRRALQELKAGP